LGQQEPLVSWQRKPAFRRRLAALAVCSLGLFAAGCFGFAELSGVVTSPTGMINLETPTLGGKQFWADVRHFHGWRIQRNAVTGHYRLLDGSDRRHAWGTKGQCLAALEQVKRDRRLPPMRGRAVVVLHGLGRSRSSMTGLCEYLRRKGGYTVFNVTYPSTRAPIAEHAKTLAEIIDHLDGIEEINFVAHSLGNIVVRRYLADQTDEATGKRPDPRIRRIVMLAPPNHGSLTAYGLAGNAVATVVTGSPGQELGRGWDELEKHLATPACEFGIIAGGKGNDNGYNPLLPGDDDGVITVATTRLAGASDFLLVPRGHTFIMDDEKVKECTLRFLKHGSFVPQDRAGQGGGTAKREERRGRSEGG